LASDPAISAILAPLLLWRRLVLQLREQSAGVRESGAFLLGRERDVARQITHFISYDKLDPDAYESGAIAFHAVGYAALWQYCRQHELQVLADVHTHPGSDVSQSPIDRKNPMVPMLDHTAIIVPNFACTRWWSLRSAGVYEYLGDFKWRTHEPSEAARRIRLVLW